MSGRLVSKRLLRGSRGLWLVHLLGARQVIALIKLNLLKITRLLKIGAEYWQELLVPAL